MHVLVCTHQTQGDHPDDLCQTLDGELATRALDCPDDLCACRPRNRFVGLGSGELTTTVEVADRPDLDEKQLGSLLLQHWSAVFADEPLVDLPTVCEIALDELGAVVGLASSFPVATVLGRARDRTVVRAAATRAGLSGGDPRGRGA